MTTAERWRPVPGFPDYEVSDQGRVRSWRQWRGRQGPRILRLQVMPRMGYHTASLYSPSGKHKTERVYRLLAAAFLGPKPKGMCIRHLDGNPENDNLLNLTYGTPQENYEDQRRHRSHANTVKTHCPRNHEYTPENTYVEAKGSRHCRACRRVRRESERKVA